MTVEAASPSAASPDRRAGPVAAAVVVEHLTVRRGARIALRDVCLGIPDAAVTCLLGPSGSGKSTLIRCIVGVQRIAAGTVTVRDVAAGSASLHRRVAYTTQMPSLYADLTLEENLRYFARLLGCDAGEVARVAAAAFAAELVGRRVQSLSGGELARASLATAMLGTPDVLVLDEPTVGLDPLLRRDLWRLFAELAAAGAAVIVSTHVMEEAQRCDHVVLLRDGTVLASEARRGLLDRLGVDDVGAAFVRLVEGGA